MNWFKSVLGAFALVVASTVGLAMFGAAPASAQVCKGLSKSACGSNDRCSYVKGFKRKDGATVKAFCRAKPGQGTAKKASSKPKKKTAKVKKPTRERVTALRADVRKCEERLAKLNEMDEKLTAKLADPALYADEKIDELEVWNRKYAELREAIDRGIRQRQS